VSQAVVVVPSVVRCERRHRRAVLLRGGERPSAVLRRWTGRPVLRRRDGAGLGRVRRARRWSPRGRSASSPALRCISRPRPPARARNPAAPPVRPPARGGPP
jgi:hypothetical protein